MNRLPLLLLILLTACAPKTHYRVAWRVHGTDFAGKGYCVDRQTAEAWAAEFTLAHPGVEHHIEACQKGR